MKNGAIAIFFDRLGPYHWARLQAAARLFHVVAITSRGAAPTSTTCHLPQNMDEVFVDTSGWYCYFVKTEPGHGLAKASVHAARKQGRSLVTTNYVLAELIKRIVVSSFSAGLAGGQLQREYLVTLGLPRNRVFTGYDVVDNEYFRQKAEEVRSQASEVRMKYGLPRKYFLASARFVPKKNLPMLIRAYVRYRRLADSGEDGQRTTDNRPWDLVLLGDGPLKADICRLISDFRLHGHVHLRGFIQYRELPAYYALADAFVHASTTEQWGLVVNEAMATGLPVIVSNRCGCVPDLVAEGKNGFTFNPESVEDLGKLMVDMSGLSDRRLEEMRAESRRIIAGFTPTHFAIAAQRAIDVAKAAPTCRATLFSSLLLKALIHR